MGVSAAQSAGLRNIGSIDIAAVINPKRTALYDLHLELGARMVVFAGYEMPVQYPGGIIHEHRQTRSRAGLFDISHMGQLVCAGTGAADLLEKLTPGDLHGLTLGRQLYTVLTNATGGIIDDLMITRTESGFYLVINAACRDKDIAHFNAVRHRDCKFDVMDDASLIALQGPASAAVLQRYHPGIASLPFMHSGSYQVNGINCLINRSGYTGEDGFEISVPSREAEAMARELLSNDEVEPAGLGARDSLRLEAGLCLYGHDINAQTTPVEAGLGWVIAKKYRGDNIVEARFPGAEKILGQFKNGTDKIRTGLRPQGKIPVREGTNLTDATGMPAGIVTSGGFGPTVGAPVAMAYVQTKYGEPGTELGVEIRGRVHKVHVYRLPFVEHRYYQPQRSS